MKAKTRDKDKIPYWEVLGQWEVGIVEPRVSLLFSLFSFLFLSFFLSIFLE